MNGNDLTKLFSLYFSIGFNLAPYPLRTNLYQSYNTQISLMTFKIADLNSLSLQLEVGLFFCQSVASERFSSDQSQGVFSCLVKGNLQKM